MVYLDNASTTYPKPESVYAETMEQFRRFGVSPSRGCYSAARDMNKIVYSTRLSLAEMFNVKDPESIVLTPSATIALNQILQGLDYRGIRTVYLSPFEHNAVLRPLHMLRKRHPFKMEFMSFHGFDWDEGQMRRMFSVDKPDLVVLSHASNVFGNILPVRDIFAMAKAYDAITVLDCSQSAGMLDTDLVDLNADFAAFPGHKGLCGPSGIGGFAIHAAIPLAPMILGGTGVKSEDLEPPEEIPDRFEAGSHNSLGIIGLNIALKWLQKSGMNSLRVRKGETTRKLFDVLAAHGDKLDILSDSTRENVGVVSCVFKNHPPKEVGALLDKSDINVRTGLHCAPYAHRHVGTFPLGTVRFSPGHFTTDEDLSALDSALKVNFRTQPSKIVKEYSGTGV